MRTKMKQNNKQELSYFRLKLRSYMSERHPERLQDTEFITARADIALAAYCDAVSQGFTYPEAESMASEDCIKVCTFPSITRLFLSWRTSLKGNCQHRSLRSSHPYCCRKDCSSHIRQVRFDGHICRKRTILPSLHRPHRHDCAAHREQ